ncbi:hypothetical protein [Agromyces sp. NPDC056965]|uniref:hypothetical protein n=1 Tax=Agromyces sp. NPDC056965 TaxID=3345983 RepID=UPI003625C7B4
MDEQSPHAADADSLRSWFWMLACMLPLAAGLTLVLRNVPRTVHTAAELAHVGFGWPIPWTTQDLTRYAPQSMPAALEYVGGKSVVDPPPTHESWGLFAADTLIIWAAVSLLIVAVIVGTRRLLSPGHPVVADGSPAGGASPGRP